MESKIPERCLKCGQWWNGTISHNTLQYSCDDGGQELRVTCNRCGAVAWCGCYDEEERDG